MNLAQRGLESLRSRIARDAVRRRLWTRAVFAFGQIHNPFQRPLLTEDDIAQVCAAVQHGDVLAVYTRRYLSSGLIPGRYKHTAVFTGHDRTGCGWIIHAAAPNVHKMPLVDFLRCYDRAAVWRPKYEACAAWKATDRAGFLAIGAGYDPFFCDTNGLWYCHEFVSHCLKAGGLEVYRTGPQYLADDIKAVCKEILEVGR